MVSLVHCGQANLTVPCTLVTAVLQELQRSLFVDVMLPAERGLLKKLAELASSSAILPHSRTRLAYSSLRNDKSS
jgi:hypothetical protein